MIKEVKEIDRFQLVQMDDDRLELRIIAEDKQMAFANAKKAVEQYLCDNGISSEVYLSEKSPEANPISGKFKHIICKKI